MNERIKELYIQSLQETRLACRPDLGPIDEEVINKILEMELRSNGTQRFAELLLKDVLTHLQREQALPPDPAVYRWTSAIEYYAQRAAKDIIFSKIIEHIKHRYGVER